MNSELRLENGVKQRMDGGGDSFGNAHREALGNWAYMQDFDSIFGFEAFAKNTSDLLFTEYEPDQYKNSGNLIRNFATIALFDRKKHFNLAERALQCSRPVLTAYYLHQCRLNASVQPIPPRFFFCVDIDEGWQLLEVDINTGEKIGPRHGHHITRENMDYVWTAIGLRDAHCGVRKWLQNRPS